MMIIMIQSHWIPVSLDIFGGLCSKIWLFRSWSLLLLIIFRRDETRWNHARLSTFFMVKHVFKPRSSPRFSAGPFQMDPQDVKGFPCWACTYATYFQAVGMKACVLCYVMWNDTVRLIFFFTYNNTCNDIIPVSKLTVAMEVMVHLVRSLSYDWLLSMVFP